MNIEQTASNSDKFAEPRQGAGAETDPGTGDVPANPARALPQTPSLFYGAAIWQLGLLLARILPTRLLKWHAAGVASIYARVFPRRREVIVQNLLPLLDGDRARAESTAAALFRQFARKLVDLWRFESGVPVDRLFSELTGWDHFLNAQKNGRGVLLVTPHLGNWEFGAPLLIKHGFKLHVITLVEPGIGLTELRQAARARQGIETLVIGRDPFAFVEIIRRLEAGATIALLIDRPPKSSAIEVELFGKPFHASIAAAELARATNCQILPVALLQTADGGYGGHMFPPIPYERATLRDRGARQELTQRILRALEPTIRQHADQWYHFVPVWKQ